MNSMNLRIWQTKSLYKVLKDKVYDEPFVNALSLKLYKNETEGVAFYCTPEIDGELEITVSAVTDEYGNEADFDFGVEFVLYVPIKRSSAGTKSEIGEYPDAVIPFELAKKYGKNRLSARKNQELRIVAKTNENTRAGRYFATVALGYNGERYEIKAEITVWDYALPSENHTKQYFIIDEKHLQLVEGGGLEKYRRYYEDLMDYRINGSRLPFVLEGDYKTATADFIKELERYYPNEKVSMVSLPIFYNEDYTDLNYERTEYVFDEVVKACVKNGVNYFTKIVTYLWILDEPHLTPAKIGYCKTVLPNFEKLKRRVAEKCDVLANENPLYKQLAEILLTIPNVITSGVLPSILPEEPNEYNITWCPAFPSHDEGITLWQVWNKGEKWWYGCDWPVPPSPTYHIDDKLLSSRLVSWMQYALEVTGNLYWRINYWARKQDGEFVYVNPYEESSFATTNGEGTLIYPGNVFGLDTFVPTIRLQSVRDGIEEFEALYALDKEMQATATKEGLNAITANELLAPIYSRLFERNQLPEELSMEFDEAREVLASILTAAARYAFFVTERNETERRIKFFTSAEKVEVEGGKLERVGKEYVVSEIGEKIIVRMQGENGLKTLTVYLETIKRPFVCSLNFNWIATEKKYAIETDPMSILKPYYDILKDESVTNYLQCTKDLSALISFVWRTETVIVKNKTAQGTRVKFFVPKGEFSAKESYTTEVLDETGRVYEFVTDKNEIEVEIKNDKGMYAMKLYL